MAGCMAHKRDGYISTSGLTSDVTIVFLDPRFSLRRGNFCDSAINERYIAYFSLRMRETAVFSTSGEKSDVTIVFLDPGFH